MSWFKLLGVASVVAVVSAFFLYPRATGEEPAAPAPIKETPMPAIAVKRPIPPMDAAAPKHVETATFAVG